MIRLSSMDLYWLLNFWTPTNSQFNLVMLWVWHIHYILSDMFPWPRRTYELTTIVTTCIKTCANSGQTIKWHGVVSRLQCQSFSWGAVGNWCLLGKGEPIFFEELASGTLSTEKETYPNVCRQQREDFRGKISINVEE